MKNLETKIVALCIVLSAWVRAADSTDLAFQIIRNDNAAGLRSLLMDGLSPNTRDEAKTTLLMVGALSGSEPCVRILLEHGADLNATNEHGLTALMWAVHDVKLVRLLLQHGADPNLRSHRDDSALSMASRIHGNLEVIKLLWENGSHWDRYALLSAVESEDLEMADWLLNKRSDEAYDLALALRSAAAKGNAAMAEWLLFKRAELIGSETDMNPRPLQKAAEHGHIEVARLLLEHGAPVNGFTRSASAASYPPLMWAVAAGGRERPALVELLLKHGADPRGSYLRVGNRFMEVPQTPLRWASKHGDRDVIEVLTEAGASSDEKAQLKEWLSQPSGGEPAVTVESLGASIERAIPLLENSALVSYADFKRRSRIGKGCVSCHQQHIPLMALSAAKQAGLPRDETTCSKILDLIVDDASSFSLRSPKPSPTLVGLMFWSLAAENVLPSHRTDIEAHRVATLQRTDGSWQSKIRPPIQSSDFAATALSLRGLQLYPIPGRRAEFEDRVQRAARWLGDTRPEENEDWGFQLLGLAWAGRGSEELSSIKKALVTRQRSNGGWAQLDGLESDAYATSVTLYALSAGGEMKPDDTAIKRGLQFLLSTQTAYGSWHVRRRAFPRQSTYESGFPHGRDAWISATATSWAIMAMSQSLRALVDEGGEPYTSKKKDVALVEPVAVLPPPDVGKVDFARDIKPLLEESCLDCHGGATRVHSRYSMNIRENLLKGGRSNTAAVIPGDSASSPLVLMAADAVEDQEMPPPHKRDFYPGWTEDQLALVRAWIDQGAQWPDDVDMDE